MPVLVADNINKTKTSEHKFAVGRQALQIAALIAAQLPESRNEAAEVLDYATHIVRSWVEMSGG